MKIEVRGEIVRAIACSRCGCRLWPHDLLAAHMARHALRDATNDDGDRPEVLWRGREKGKAVKKTKRHSKWDLPHRKKRC